jgi:small subunit ribosomal protein S15
MSTMTKEEKFELIQKFGSNDKDSGKPEVQIALLTRRINDLTSNISTRIKRTITQEEV